MLGRLLKGICAIVLRESLERKSDDKFWISPKLTILLTANSEKIEYEIQVNKSILTTTIQVTGLEDQMTLNTWTI